MFDKKRILVIDESRDFFYQITGKVDFEKVSPLFFTMARELLNAVKNESADLIFLNWTLPDVKGLRVIETIKKDPITSAIPIITIDAYPPGSQRELEENLKNYVQESLHKPIDDKKIEEDPSQPTLIITKPGIGYLFSRKSL